MTRLDWVLNPRFRVRNLAAYNFAAFAGIAFIVFLLASQPFYLADVIGITPGHIGAATGTLGVVDELTAIVASPVLGTLNDRLQGLASRSRKVAAGPRLLQLAGFAAIALALLGYGALARGRVVALYCLRSLFAVGVSAVMGMAVVMLHEASNSDLAWPALWRWTRAEEHTLTLLLEANTAQDMAGPGEKQSGGRGKLSGLLGMCAGTGAVFAVAVLVPLPARLSVKHSAWLTAACLVAAYAIVALLALACGFVVYLFAYDAPRQRRDAGDSTLALGASTTYLQLMREAIAVSRRSRGLQLAYLGGFIARATAIATSVFTPLVVYKFYLAIGECGAPENAAAVSGRAEAPSKNDCYNAFIFLAILTGVASTASLVSAPAWSFVVDARRLGCLFALLLASALNCIGCFLLCYLGLGASMYDPRTAASFVLLSLLGVAQMGTIVASMSLVSQAGLLLEDGEARVIGSITGLYNFCGGIGILVISKLGGSWSDRWVFGPFLILGLFSSVLMALSVLTMRLIR